jgi:hypothetical protein
LAAKVQEPTLEMFPERPTTFFAGLAFAVVVGAAIWSGVIVLALWLAAG